MITLNNQKSNSIVDNPTWLLMNLFLWLFFLLYCITLSLHLQWNRVTDFYTYCTYIRCNVQYILMVLMVVKGGCACCDLPANREDSLRSLVFGIWMELAGADGKVVSISFSVHCTGRANTLQHANSCTQPSICIIAFTLVLLTTFLGSHYYSLCVH